MHQSDKETLVMNDEEYIKERIGKENPFRVPDGYFDGLASTVMARLPDEQRKAIIAELPRKWGVKHFLYVAACVCAAVFGVAVYTTTFTDNTEPKQAQNTVSHDSYMEDVADYTMMDNTDIYVYLASE